MRLENERKIGELVLSLLSHYWTAEDDPAVRKLQANDWIDDLVEFSPEVVEEACRMWRHAHDKRPTPFDIRMLCRTEQEIRRQDAAEKKSVDWDATWPSEEHWATLKAKTKTKGGLNLDNLSMTDRRMFHAYTNAFRQHVGLTGNDPRDPRNKHFSEELLDRARTALYPIPKPKEDNITPAERYDRWGDKEMAEHCRRQDRERAEAWKPHYQWRDANGNPTPEAEAYAALCKRQATENEKIFLARNADLRKQTPVDDLALDALERAKRDLGVSARETRP